MQRKYICPSAKNKFLLYYTSFTNYSWTIHNIPHISIRCNTSKRQIFVLRKLPGNSSLMGKSKLALQWSASSLASWGLPTRGRFLLLHSRLPTGIHLPWQKRGFRGLFLGGKYCRPYQAFVLFMDSDRCIFLTGPTGCGKSSVINYTFHSNINNKKWILWNWQPEEKNSGGF